MKMIQTLLAAGISALLSISAASAAFSGYINIPDIDGESARAAGANSSRSVGANETISVGANRTETIKGGQAVITGVLWNGSDAPPARGAKATAKIFVKPGALSASMQRLYSERRVIPSMTLVVTGDDGKQVKYELQRVLVTSWSTSASGRSDHEGEIDIHSVNW